MCTIHRQTWPTRSTARGGRCLGRQTAELIGRARAPLRSPPPPPMVGGGGRIQSAAGVANTAAAGRGAACPGETKGFRSDLDSSRRDGRHGEPVTAATPTDGGRAATSAGLAATWDADAGALGLAVMGLKWEEREGMKTLRMPQHADTEVRLRTPAVLLQEDPEL